MTHARLLPSGSLRAPLASLALVGLLACASSPSTPPPAPPTAAEAGVRVVNNTSSDVRVEADGRSLGAVRAGGEQLFVGLSPGTINLRGASQDGQLVFRRDLLTLEPGETFTWILREGASGEGDPSRTAAPNAATIVVENETSWPVEVLVDGRSLGSVSAGASGRFGGIAPGSRRLEARAAETTFPQEYPVLEAGESFTWRLRAPGAPTISGAGGILPTAGTGRLRVENPHGEPLTVLANGTPLGRVEARSTRIFDELTPARVLLAAESADRRSRYRGPAGLIEAGRVLTWRIGSGEVSAGAVAGPPAETPRVPAAPLPLPPAAAIPPPDEGPVGEEAGGREVEPMEEPIRTGEPAGGVPGAATGDRVFVVENQTTQDLEILLDGQSVGAVGAGMTGRFTELPGTRFRPSARNASGKKTYDHPEVDLSSRQSFTWIILP